MKLQTDNMRSGAQRDCRARAATPAATSRWSLVQSLGVPYAQPAAPKRARAARVRFEVLA